MSPPHRAVCPLGRERPHRLVQVHRRHVPVEALLWTSPAAAGARRGRFDSGLERRERRTDRSSRCCLRVAFAFLREYLSRSLLDFLRPICVEEGAQRDKTERHTVVEFLFFFSSSQRETSRRETPMPRPCWAFASIPPEPPEQRNHGVLRAPYVRSISLSRQKNRGNKASKRPRD